jgi:hypothetical protein
MGNQLAAVAFNIKPSLSGNSLSTGQGGKGRLVMDAPTEAEIATFIRVRGVTRCPTACVAPTQASGSAADRAALRSRVATLETIPQKRMGSHYLQQAGDSGRR